MRSTSIFILLSFVLLTLTLIALFKKDFNAAMEQLKALSIVKEISSVIRVYGGKN